VAAVLTVEIGMSSPIKKKTRNHVGVVSAFESGLMWVLFGSGDQNTRVKGRREDVIGPISLPFISS